MNQGNVEAENEDYYESELEDQLNFSLKFELKLDQYGEQNDNKEPEGAQADISSQNLLQLLFQINLSEALPPPLCCGTRTCLPSTHIQINLGNIFLIQPKN